MIAEVSLYRGTRGDLREPCLILDSPYHPAFPDAAKKLGGHWTGKRWLFDIRDEARVAALCERVYGINPLDGPPEVVTVQVMIGTDETIAEAKLWAFGRLVVERRYSDDDIWLGAGVIIVNGEFHRSAGSRRDPIVGRPLSPVTLEIRDVPVSLLAREKRNYTIIESSATEDLSIERRVNAILKQVEQLNPAGRAALLLRLRDVPVGDDL